MKDNKIFKNNIAFIFVIQFLLKMFIKRALAVIFGVIMLALIIACTAFLIFYCKIKKENEKKRKDEKNIQKFNGNIFFLF